MNTRKYSRRSFGLSLIAVATATALAITGCQPGPTGFQGVPGFAKGVITAKGSIFVNGIEYETDASSITVDDIPGTDADLAVGMIVSVKGEIDAATGKGVADRVEYAKSIEGTIDAASIVSASAPSGSFDLFGVTVTVDATTLYEGAAGLTALVAGDRVEVSGVAIAAGIHASRVEVKAASSEDFNLKGVVSDLASGSFTLTTGGGEVFAVTYTGTLDAAIADGSAVEVEFDTAPVAGALATTAAKIETEDGLEPSEGERTELEGIVSAYAAGSPATFILEGMDVSVPAGATLRGTLADGVEAEVKGTMDGGVLVAESVEVEIESDSELEGPVGSVNAGAGTIVIAGVTVVLDADTIFRDEDWGGHVAVERFGIADLATGDYLQVEAFMDGSTVTAAKIERDDPSGTVDATLKGEVTAVTPSTSVTLLGATLDISGLTPPAIVVGDYVKLSGSATGGVITWDTIEIDN